MGRARCLYGNPQQIVLSTPAYPVQRLLLFFGGLLGPPKGAILPISPGAIWNGRLDVAMGIGPAPFRSLCALALRGARSLVRLACEDSPFGLFAAVNG